MIPVNYNSSSSSSLVQLPEGMLLTKHFTLKELSNTSGSKELAQYEISSESMAFNDMLEEFRLYYNHPIAPTSGYRQVEYNKQVGGAYNSLHLHACACDFVDQYKMDPAWMMSTWLRVLSRANSIGAVNLYDNGNYYRYHVEAFSDVFIGYAQSQVRIYTNEQDFGKYLDMYQPLGYSVVYYG